MTNNSLVLIHQHCFNFFVQVSVGPFTIIKSIDSLIEALADVLSKEQRGFTLSTKNIGNNIFRPITYCIIDPTICSWLCNTEGGKKIKHSYQLLLLLSISSVACAVRPARCVHEVAETVSREL